ncbi:hypothetical protein HZH68_008564 [Vespula germanica]|uniref:Uncharacterized protein n=1 Tax=Vespula germanica TaxID=30212 RepID=A0A834JZK4_VESGE|nr:hypothetical protein HZH68_008564 [Vespula germanica]
MEQLAQFVSKSFQENATAPLPVVVVDEDTSSQLGFVRSNTERAPSTRITLSVAHLLGDDNGNECRRGVPVDMCLWCSRDLSSGYNGINAKRSPDGKSANRESSQEGNQSNVEVGNVEEPPSPETRLQPEDLSVATKIKDVVKEVKASTENVSPLKTPELKLSVRKLLGCSPSPPPITRDRSASPENCTESKSRVTSADVKTTINDSKLTSQVARSLVHNQEEAAKGRRPIKLPSDRVYADRSKCNDH